MDCNSAVMMRGANSTIANSTIAYNELTGDLCRSYPHTRGAVRAVGTLHLQSTIVANNIGPFQVSGNSRTDTLQGNNNVITSSRLALPPGTLTFDPMLAPLADNGGAGMTHALVEGSPAVNRGNNSAGLAYDQRGAGHPRVRGPQADIGAFEGTVPPSTIAVTNCNDAGAGSLRDAVARSSERGTVDMSALTCGTIKLTSGVIAIPQNDLILRGPGYDRLTISGNNASQVFSHSGTGYDDTLQFRGLTVAYGQLRSNESHAFGGCIRSWGSVEVIDSQIHHCLAESTLGADGGGIFAGGHVTLTRSAVFANAARAPQYYASGGGIYVFGGLTLDRSVLCDNVADTDGGGASVGGSTPGGTGGLTMDQSTVCRNTSGSAAAIYVQGGPTSITDSTIFDNRGLNGSGGVVITGGPVTVANSTFSGNTSAVSASALHMVNPQGTWRVVRNSTFAFNQELAPSSQPWGCYGALSVGGPVRLQSNIVAHNMCGDTPADLGSGGLNSAVDGADNLIMSSSLPTPPDTLTADPRLAPLADNGGRTRTHALLDGSPAINTGNNAAGLLYDQRGPGFPRVEGPQADIGAYER